MKPKEPNKEKKLSAFYGGKSPGAVAVAAKPASTRGKKACNDRRSKANPSIVLLDPLDKEQPVRAKRHPPPPRRLPANIAAAGRAAGGVASSSASAVLLEEDVDDGEEENDQLDNEAEEGAYVPDEEEEQEYDNSYDHDDVMSEDDAVGLDRINEEEQTAVDVSSTEEQTAVDTRFKGKKKKKGKTTTVENSKAWIYFEKVWVDDEDNPEGPKVLKAQCLHCPTIYAYEQDCCTRWSSTYKMIATGRPYREALREYANKDLHYIWQPTSDEWKLYELIEPMLFAFAQVTTAFSAQSYPTANIFYRHIVSIKIALKKAMRHKDPTYKAMGEAMMDKFNKYWEEKNNVMVLATVLDPRYKMFYIDWAFKQLYDEITAADELADVRVELEELFEKFDSAKKQSDGATSSAKACISSTSMPASDSDFQTHRLNTTTKSSKSELRNYLEDALEEPDAKFNLLDWWKVNSLRYPLLAKMARRFLTIPASSVSSESTFSTGGRVLDDYRSSLKPDMVEALVCGASYIKGSYSDLNVQDKEEDEEENVETIKLPNSAVIR